MNNDCLMNYCMKWLCDCDCNCPPAQFQAAYGYIYRLNSDELKLDNDKPIPFNNTGILKGIIHDEVNSPTVITILNTGIYEVTYYATPNNKIELTLELNGKLLDGNLVDETRYLPNNASSIAFGQAIIKVTKINSVLKVMNNTETGSQAIFPKATEDARIIVDASIIIKKIDNI